MKIIDLSVSIVDGLPVDRPVQIPSIRYRRHTDEESVSTFLAVFSSGTLPSRRILIHFSLFI